MPPEWWARRKFLPPFLRAEIIEENPRDWEHAPTALLPRGLFSHTVNESVLFVLLPFVSLITAFFCRSVNLTNSSKGNYLVVASVVTKQNARTSV